MGWDISYHPISEEQIKSWYFDVLEDKNAIELLSQQYSLDDFYKQKYLDTIDVALKTDAGGIFDKTHGYYIAVVQGFFEKYFYVRGGALSFSESGNLKKYFKEWETFIPREKLTENVYNQIVENYCSGVFLPNNQVKQLLEDYKSDPSIKNELDDLFSPKYIGVFLKALEYADEKGLGILEATEVMEPNPIDLNQSSCYSNLYNCDPEGALLYQEATLELIAEIENQQGGQKAGTPPPTYTVIHTKESEKKEEKKGFWKKLFGK